MSMVESVIERAGACRQEMIASNAASLVPRSCPRCGIGPCAKRIDQVDPPRVGDWMQTYTGGAFWPLDPRPEEVRIDDIAHALSKLCRYGGHSIRWYSVAEHCVHVAEHAPDEFKLDALMHDASEAYLQDVIRPIKRHLTNYEAIESRLSEVIARRFKLRYPLPDVVKHLDNAILADERDQAMNRPPRDWNLSVPGLGVELKFWTPAKAVYEFMSAFYRYGGHYA